MSEQLKKLVKTSCHHYNNLWNLTASLINRSYNQHVERLCIPVVYKIKMQKLNVRTIKKLDKTSCYHYSNL